MTKVSRRFLNKELENYIFEVFIKTIIELRNPQDVQNFIEDLLSPTERIMLVKRLAIAILLAKAYTYDNIDDTLKVSRPTITKVSFFLKHGKSGYRKVVNKILEQQRNEALIDKVEEILIRLSPPKRYGSIEFESKQKVGKELFRRKLKRGMLSYQRIVFLQCGQCDRPPKALRRKIRFSGSYRSESTFIKLPTIAPIPNKRINKPISI